MKHFKNTKIHLLLVASFVALSTASCGGGSGKTEAHGSSSPSVNSISSSSFSTTSTLKDQTITFTNDQPIVVEGNKLTDSVTAQGIGNVFYVSGNPNIATVDNAGEVTGIAPGQTTITAIIEADHVYKQASVSHTIKVLSKPIEMSMWIGSDALIIDLPDEAIGSYLYRTTDKDCELTKILECNAGAAYPITGNSLEDPFSISNEEAYYSLVKAEQKATVVITATSTNTNNLNVHDLPIKPTEFNNKLWRVHLVKDPVTSNYLDFMSYSTNGGRSWEDRKITTLFGMPRTNVELIHFNHKFWFFEGSKPFPFTYPYYADDVWSSVDGISWELEYEHGLSRYPSCQYQEFDNKLWRICGRNEAYSYGDPMPNNSISYSSDGVYWVVVTPIPSILDNSLDVYPKTTVSNDKLWMLLNSVENQASVRKVWSSNDGINWQLSSTLDAEVPSSTLYTDKHFLDFNKKIWIFSSTDQTFYAQSSGDGVTWDLAATNLTGYVYYVINYNNGLLAATGEGVWFSTDAIQWKKGFTTTFDFSQP